MAITSPGPGRGPAAGRRALTLPLRGARHDKPREEPGFDHAAELRTMLTLWTEELS